MYVSKNYDSQNCGLVFHFINFDEKRMPESKFSHNAFIMTRYLIKTIYFGQIATC